MLEQLDNWRIAYIRSDHVPLRFVEESNNVQGQFLSSERGGFISKTSICAIIKSGTYFWLTSKTGKWISNLSILNWELHGCHLDQQKDWWKISVSGLRLKHRSQWAMVLRPEYGNYCANGWRSSRLPSERKLNDIMYNEIAAYEVAAWESLQPFCSPCKLAQGSHAAIGCN